MLMGGSFRGVQARRLRRAAPGVRGSPPWATRWGQYESTRVGAVVWSGGCVGLYPSPSRRLVISR
jgi:hypothetical protein